MKLLRTFAVMALAFLATPLPAAEPIDPPSIIGRLNYVSGQVSFASGDAANEWRVAPLNRPLTTGDRLWIDNGGRAEMHVGSNSIRMAEQTNIDVLAIDDRLVQLGLAQGTLHVHLRRPLGGGVFEIASPHGAVQLTQPGIYRVSVEPSGATTTLVVREGHAEVLTATARFPVRARSQVMFPAARIEAVAAAPLDEFDRWAEGRDQKRARLVAARHVPPEMTGYEDLDDHGSWRTVPTYGTVWVPSRVAAGWAPFRDGHWVWVSPWGWTWVDDAPWGFAPAHYGRWVWVDRYWAWAPGPVTVRPVYAPAVVAFIGGANFSVSIGARAAPAVAWVPLGWREPYIPWYRVSPTYVRNVNVAYVRDINVTNIYNIVNRNTTVTHIRYVNRNVPSAVTVTSRDVFVGARRVEPVRVAEQTIRSAPVVAAAPVQAPEKTSFAAPKPGNKPPPAAAAREVVAATQPPTRVRDERAAAAKKEDRQVTAKDEERPRVRVISREGAAAPAAGDAKQQTDRAKAADRDEKSAQKAGPQQAEPQKGPDREEKAAQEKGTKQKAAPQQAEREKAHPQAEREKGPGKAAQQKETEQKAAPQQAEREKGPAREDKAAQQKGPEQKTAPQQAEREKAQPQAERQKGPEKSAQQKGQEKAAPQQAERGKGAQGEEKARSQAKSEERADKAQEAQRAVPPPAAGGERPAGKAEREDSEKKKPEREAN